MSFGTWVRGVTAVGVTAVALQVTSGAQDRLKAMPGYEQFEKMRVASRGLESSLGTPTITWSDDSSTFEYTREGKRYRFDVATRQASVSGDAPEGPGRGGRARPRAAGVAATGSPSPLAAVSSIPPSRPTGRSRRSTRIATCGSATLTAATPSP